MNPRVVTMAKAVRTAFSTNQLETYGNVILNGYLSVVPNTVGKKAWQYKETTTPPINLPSLTSVSPILRGWTTNYEEYYTRVTNTYGVHPGDSTGFLYSVHSFDSLSNTRWAQPPHRYNQQQTATFNPPSANQKAIQYSFLYPVVDNSASPPIDTL